MESLDIQSAEAAAPQRTATLIAREGRRASEFPGYFANHLPMVIEAMAWMGASPGRQDAFAADYVRENEVSDLPPAQGTLPADPWHTALGLREYEGDWRAHFADLVARQGIAATVRAALPTLAPGVAASALHPLMRLAYATMREDATEVSNALGYWAATWRAFPPPEGPRTPTGPAALVAEMRSEPALHGVDGPTHLLWLWIAHMGTLPEFRRLTGRVPSVPDQLPEMRRASLALYAGTMSFEALHAVTGCHWLRLLDLPHDLRGELAGHFWDVVLALYAKIGLPALPSEDEMTEMRRLPVPEDSVIRAAAVASDDEHDLSLVFSALEEFRFTGDPLYRVVAARRLGLA